tara:strand:- start:2148 stop:2783 length:636 start_codon:yes stop_codon:yes gene_type:complete
MRDFSWIINESNLPWLELDITFPFEEMHQEAINLKDRFVKHRDQDGHGGYRHKGWRSLCIHGIDAEKTNHYEEYGYKSNQETPYNWTEIIDQCPITYKFFKEVFPYKSYYRVRFMLLEPEGFITPHQDTFESKLSPINMALNHPKGCLMKMEGHKGYVPFSPGKAMLLDVGNTHAYINKSREDRYHIIVHGTRTKEYEKLVIRSYEKNGIK